MTKDEKTARGCASKIVDDYIPRWGCPHTFLSDRGTEFISQVGRAVYETLGTVSKEIYKFLSSPDEWNGRKAESYPCLLYTSPSPRDKRQSRMPSSA